MLFSLLDGHKAIMLYYEREKRFLSRFSPPMHLSAADAAAPPRGVQDSPPGHPFCTLSSISVPLLSPYSPFPSLTGTKPSCYTMSVKRDFSATFHRLCISVSSGCNGTSSGCLGREYSGHPFCAVRRYFIDCHNPSSATMTGGSGGQIVTHDWVDVERPNHDIAPTIV